MNLLMNPIVLHVEEFQAEFQISDGLYYAETICFCKKNPRSINNHFAQSEQSLWSQQSRERTFLFFLSGASLEQVRRVHPHPLKFDNGYTIPVLRIENWIEDSKFQKTALNCT